MDFVTSFRQSAPYIHAYRGKTTVLWLRSTLPRQQLATLVSDMSLLNSLGLRLVVVFDAHVGDVTPNRYQPIDPQTLAALIAQIGQRRYELEALFSQGVINSPMHGANVHVVSGNFVTARPAGVVQGNDLLAQGRVRRIDHASIKEHLNNQSLVLLPPLGYSVTGDILYLASDVLVLDVAKQLNADKVVIIGHDPHAITEGRKEVTIDQLEQLLASSSADAAGAVELQVAAQISRAGIARCHVINALQDGALLGELFTRDGVGTLIARDHYDTFRKATLDDVQGILALLKPLEDKYILVKRDQEKLERDIDCFIVNERDGMIVGCAAFHPINDEMAELASVAVHKDYQHGGRGNALLKSAERAAKALNLNKLMVLTTQTEHWFIERGFQPADVTDLPMEKQQAYNAQRRSKVYIKALD